MATTDARSGFRLPWSSDRGAESDSVSEATAAEETPSSETTAPEDSATTVTTAAPEDGGSIVDPWTGVASVPTPTPASEDVSATTPAPQPTRKPNKFLADLTKAMQAAAEEARSHSLQQLQADAKTHIETIHGRSSTEAASLRRQADDDVAAVREWSKTEIARVREETEQKITDRKSRLETEIEEHAAVIEREIDAVQRMVTTFETEMADFFERLLAEADPTRFATMAENLPEPPTFDEISAKIGLPAEAPESEAASVETTAEVSADADVVEGAVAEPVTDEADTTEAEAEAVTADAPEGTESGVAESTDPEGTIAETAMGDTETETTAELTEAEAPEAMAEGSETDPESAADGGEAVGEMRFDGVDVDEEVDREAAFAAIQAAAEAAASAEVAADAAARAEAVADVAIEIMGNYDGEDGESDPRFAALGLSPDYDAAEAEALAAADGTNADGEEIPVIGDDALAARLAGLVPEKGEETPAETASTQVIVVGLISVASIASFKRHLGRLAGVRSVGVSSGPDGEFVFAVTHSTDTALREVIPSLPSFQARVTSASDGVVHVTAHDPEADA
jgi:hypothetical protein